MSVLLILSFVFIAYFVVAVLMVDDPFRNQRT